MFRKLKVRVLRIIRFLTHGIWRVDDGDVTKKRLGLYDIIKSFILAYRNINGSQLNTRAAALTYSTLLSIVPLLAVLLAIARGFGFQNLVREQLSGFFTGQDELFERIMGIIYRSIDYAQGGFFVGIGVILLLYTTVNLLSNIETNFNKIWRIKRSRSYYRMFTDYLALIIILPIFLICNASISIFLGAAQELQVIGLVISPVIKVIPYVLVILMFTIMYLYIPNTKVKFKSALLAGAFSGTIFQVFQMVYISGQIWISKYNAIYGNFAILPLLLLWLQVSWFIVLFGVELSYANQNVSKFEFERETNNISRRYKDFIILLVTTLIIKRFADGKKPYTADAISEEYKLPSRLTADVIHYLQTIGIIIETPTEEPLIPAYVPASDINKISIAYLFDKMSSNGSEQFRIDTKVKFKKEWDTVLSIHNNFNKTHGDLLLKDL